MTRAAVVCQLLGAVLITVACAAFAWWLGMLFAGAYLMAVGFALERAVPAPKPEEG